MNCFVHPQSPAVGLCGVCQRGVCRQCVGLDSPRLVCQACLTTRATWGFEFRSRATIGDWPLVHIATGWNPVTMRPQVAKGIVAIGNIAVGVIAVGGLACGLITVGGASIGILLAIGGAALGLGVSFGGLAVGAIAVGGAAIGYTYAFGGGAIGPSIIDGRRCDRAALEFARQWLHFIGTPPNCR